MMNSCIVSFIFATLLFLNSSRFTYVRAQNSTDIIDETKKVYRFVVPDREFKDFVKVTHLDNGEKNFSGFSIELFERLAKIAIPSNEFKFEVFNKGDGTMNFDDMLMKVKEGKYDGAVGEITILFSRIQQVDFTMPYLTTEIGMLVPTKYVETVGLTLVAKIVLIVALILAFGILVAVLLWIWKLCKYKCASPSIKSSVDNDNITGVFWAKIIMYMRLLHILMLMGLLLIIASYVPSQTPLFDTKSQIVNINMDQAKIGYRKGAFVKNKLIQYNGFSESRLVELNSEVELLHKLQQGSQNDGIDALVAGTHNLKLFQRKHCQNFTLHPQFRLPSTGIGFAFPKGSTLVNKFSEAIVRMIDNEEIAGIQKRTIGSLENVCPNAFLGSKLQQHLSFWLPTASALFVVGMLILMLISHCIIQWLKK